MPTEMPTEINDILAQQLRDIHLPEAVGWWPLATGWWLLIIVTVSMVSFLVYRLVQARKQNRYRKSALAELQDAYKSWLIDLRTTAYLQRANTILKRTFKAFSSSPDLLSRSGSDWADTLNTHATIPLSEDMLTALTSACYQAQPKIDVDLLHQQLEAWIKTHRNAADV